MLAATVSVFMVYHCFSWIHNVQSFSWIHNVQTIIHGPRGFSTDMAAQHDFSGPVTVFHERALSERATPAGYAALPCPGRFPRRASTTVLRIMPDGVS